MTFSRKLYFFEAGKVESQLQHLKINENFYIFLPAKVPTVLLYLGITAVLSKGIVWEVTYAIGFSGLQISYTKWHLSLCSYSP